MIQKLGCMIHCVSHPFWNLSYPNHKFTFFSSVWLALFQSTIPPNPTLKKMHFCYTFTFSIIHPTLSHPIQLLKLFCSSVRLSLFQSSIPPNPTFEIVWHFLITFPFSIFHPTQIPLTNIKFSFRYRRIDMPKKSEGGWSGIGMANSGIDPTHVYFLNDHPTQIPPSEILGPVVQNCHKIM